jgi:hypothetical protein
MPGKCWGKKHIVRKRFPEFGKRKTQFSGVASKNAPTVPLTIIQPISPRSRGDVDISLGADEQTAHIDIFVVNGYMQYRPNFTTRILRHLVDACVRSKMVLNELDVPRTHCFVYVGSASYTSARVSHSLQTTISMYTNHIWSNLTGLQSMKKT